MAMAGIREVLVYSENEQRVVTVSTANTLATGKVIRVNPLIIDQGPEKGVMVVNFESIQSVMVHDATGEQVVQACKPQSESRFMGRPGL